jgi:hypothetical protein
MAPQSGIADFTNMFSWKTEKCPKKQKRTEPWGSVLFCGTVLPKHQPDILLFTRSKEHGGSNQS